jgi:hypothetical protein
MTFLNFLLNMEVHIDTARTGSKITTFKFFPYPCGFHLGVVDIGDVPSVGEELAADGHRRNRSRSVHVNHRLGIPKGNDDFQKLRRLSRVQ